MTADTYLGHQRFPDMYVSNFCNRAFCASESCGLNYNRALADVACL